jgi:hypothetical protein
MDAVRRKQGNDQLMAWPQYDAKTTPMRVRQRGLSRAEPNGSAAADESSPSHVLVLVGFGPILQANDCWVQFMVLSLRMDFNSYGPLIMEEGDWADVAAAAYFPTMAHMVVPNYK